MGRGSHAGPISIDIQRTSLTPVGGAGASPPATGAQRTTAQVAAPADGRGSFLSCPLGMRLAHAAPWNWFGPTAPMPAPSRVGSRPQAGVACRGPEAPRPALLALRLGGEAEGLSGDPAPVGGRTDLRLAIAVAPARARLRTLTRDWRSHDLCSDVAHHASPHRHLIGISTQSVKRRSHQTHARRSKAAKCAKIWSSSRWSTRSYRDWVKLLTTE